MAASARSTPHRLAGAALALLVLGAQLALLPRSAPEPAAGGPGALLGLLAPGVFSDASDPGGTQFGAPHPPAGANLAARALLRAGNPPARGAPYVGLATLLLAVMAAVTARGRWAWAARGAALLGVVAVAGPLTTGPVTLGPVSLGPIGASLAVAGLAALGAFGLASLADDATGGGAPALVLGSAAVALAAVLGALSLQAGAIPDAELTAPLLARLPGAPSGAGTDWSISVLAANAAHLRTVLDRSALAAFATMTALLLHLKGRGRWTLVLLLLVAAADLLSARLA